ncbi:hypothetical protein A5892_10340 [Halotalea alkalilenta]|uniref:Lysine transporter LysE n=2 Tax=Halotalea alkalilenta TaxID=376489 RepID=A0A172YK65_9GAMM|nr:hypothetical protein A5892_10340 [Halotalea alkalilenta]
MLASWLDGWIMGLGLIVAIGAQNAYVLQQGMRGRHPWMVASICTLCDVGLTALGVFGVASALQAWPKATRMLAWAAAALLLLLAGQAFWRAVFQRRGLHPLDAPAGSRLATLFATLAVSLLNPHVYLDTVAMLGGIGATRPSPLGFVIGAACASAAWFFSLVAGARRFAATLASARSWRWIDGAIGTVLLAIAIRLLHG